jgi:hypothetical protein
MPQQPIEDDSSHQREALDSADFQFDIVDNSMNNDDNYNVVSNESADKADFSDLRGVTSGDSNLKRTKLDDEEKSSEADLDNLAELVPQVRERRRQPGTLVEASTERVAPSSNDDDVTVEKEVDVKVDEDGAEIVEVNKQTRKMSIQSVDTNTNARISLEQVASVPYSPVQLNPTESMHVQESRDMNDERFAYLGQAKELPEGMIRIAEDEATSGRGHEDTSLGDDYPGSDHVLEDTQEEAKVPKEFMNIGSSAQSISTATQTHEVRMPMFLPTFKPATGCTNASDFIVRCFVARLRSGITVCKHARSRWCKSRLRVLHIHPDGRSLSWKPAEGEPTSSKRPPKLDLSTCLEVRHAWSPDPLNQMYTGTPVLRLKCEAANAHKSFALIFKQRTVDITALTADQCKVLMEGFSALCFRLQVANLAGRGAKKGHARPMPEEDGVSTTASATLTNSSTPRGVRPQ